MAQHNQTASPERFPRVLCVNGEPIANLSATGITLGELFSGWPLDRLAQIYTAPLTHGRRSELEVQLRPLDRVGTGWIAHKRQTKAGEVGRSDLPRAGAVRGLKETLRPMLRGWLDIVPYRLPADVKGDIAEFHPDVVYTCLGNIQISNLALHCARLADVPIVPHFMDDWLATAYAGRAAVCLQRQLLLRAVRGVLAASRIGMAISDVMAQEYGARFGIPFESFMNPCSIEQRGAVERSADGDAEVQFVYVGGLHLGRWRSLQEMGTALSALSSDGIRATLRVYAPAADLVRFGRTLAACGIEPAGSLTQDQVPEVLARADVLVHVESFDESNRKYTRLSVSTKIPQYMSAAKPLFCYGPGEVASLRLVEQEQCGLVVGSRDASRLTSALKRIAEDSALRRSLGENAVAVARRKFEVQFVRERFRRVLANAAGAKASSCIEPARSEQCQRTRTQRKQSR